MVSSTYLLLLVLALAAGLVAALAVARQWADSQQVFFRHYLTHVLLFNLLILGGMVFAWSTTTPQGLPVMTPLVVLTLMAGLKLGWLQAFMLASSHLASPRKPPLLIANAGQWALLIWLLYVAATWLAWFRSNGVLMDIAVTALEVLVLGGALLASVLVLATTRSLPPGPRNHSLLTYGGFHVLLLALLLVMMTAGWLQDGAREQAQAMGSATILLLFNFFPPAWLRWFAPPGPRSSTRSFDRLGITAREQQIIGLIQAGKTNREIAAELFLSEATVKDYNNRLFRKCGVRNRVELANLFR